MTKGPYYIGIGANRCGTSSLHFTLKKHPQLREFRGKELHFWDQKIKRKSISWYLHRFRPIGSQKAGEITPAYYRTPHLPKKLAACLPDVKLLLLLRNPAEALFSDYRRGVHRRSFPEGFEEHVDAYLDGKGSDEFFARRYYAAHLELWLKHYPKEQLWIVQSERLWEDPGKVLATLWEFLEVRSISLAYPHVRAHRRRPMSSQVRERLQEHFHPHNERLYTLLGERYDWE